MSANTKSTINTVLPSHIVEKLHPDMIEELNKSGNLVAIFNDKYFIKEKQVVDTFLSNKEILWMSMKVDHDGYDNYGPESNLVSLYIITKENDTYDYYMFYYEDWFNGTNEEYELNNHFTL